VIASCSGALSRYSNWIKFLNAMIIGIGHIRNTAAIHGNPCGIIELPVAISITTPSGNKVSVVIKHLDSMVPRIGDKTFPPLSTVNPEG
jgi:hypothetical protein